MQLNQQIISITILLHQYFRKIFNLWWHYFCRNYHFKDWINSFKPTVTWVVEIKKVANNSRSRNKENKLYDSRQITSVRETLTISWKRIICYRCEKIALEVCIAIYVKCFSSSFFQKLKLTIKWCRYCVNIL